MKILRHAGTHGYLVWFSVLLITVAMGLTACSQPPTVVKPDALHPNRPIVGAVNSSRQISNAFSDEGEMMEAWEEEAEYEASLAYWRQLLRGLDGELALANWLQVDAQLQQMKAAHPVDVIGQMQRSLGLLPPTDSVTAATAGLGSPAQWQWLGPANITGRLESVLVDPTNPARLWVGSSTGGIWKSANGGATWSPVYDAVAGVQFTNLIMDPANAQVMYATSYVPALDGTGMPHKSLLFRSTDGGEHWSIRKEGTLAGDAPWQFIQLLFAGNSNPLLAIDGNNLWQSSDGGATWAKRSTAYDLHLNQIAFDPQNGQNAVASGNALAYYSTDGGSTWRSASLPPVPASAWRLQLTYARSNPSIIYGAYKTWTPYPRIVLLKSTDGGRTYSELREIQDYGSGTTPLWVDPTNPAIMVVGDLNLHRSTDGGVTFERINEPDIDGYSPHVDQTCIVAHPLYNGTAHVN